MSSIQPVSETETTPVYTKTKKSISDIILEIGIAAIQANEDKMTFYYDIVQQNNRKLENYNNAMAVANKYTQSGGYLDDRVTFTYTDPITGKTSTKTLKSFMDENRISYPEGVMLSNEKWGIIVSNLKGASDTIGSNNQIDMMKLNSVVNKQSEMTEMIVSNESKLHQIAMTINSKM